MGDLLGAFLYLQHLVRAELREALTELDLTPVQSTVLHMIADTPGISPADLARRNLVAAQTMHRIVTDLQRRGLLTLQPRPGHGRILDAHLTDQGRHVLAESDKLGQAIEDRMASALNQQQQRQLTALLRQCITAFAPPNT